MSGKVGITCIIDFFFFFTVFFNCFSFFNCPVTLPSPPVAVFRVELQASEGRYQAQRRITQLLQTELLQLYSRVETEAPAGTAASSPSGGRAEPADARLNFFKQKFICNNKSITSLCVYVQSSYIYTFKFIHKFKH